jgi:hypothetical protein
MTTNERQTEKLLYKRGYNESGHVVKWYSVGGGPKAKTRVLVNDVVIGDFTSHASAKRAAILFIANGCKF